MLLHIQSFEGLFDGEMAMKKTETNGTTFEHKFGSIERLLGSFSPVLDHFLLRHSVIIAVQNHDATFSKKHSCPLLAERVAILSLCLGTAQTAANPSISPKVISPFTTKSPRSLQERNILSPLLLSAPTAALSAASHSAMNGAFTSAPVISAKNRSSPSSAQAIRSPCTARNAGGAISGMPCHTKERSTSHGHFLSNTETCKT